MATVTDDEIRRWWPVVEAHARKLAGKASYLVEFDDLVQEGITHVWLELEKGNRITNDIMRDPMKNWIRYVTHGGRANEATV